MSRAQLPIEADGRIAPSAQARLASFLMAAHGAHALALQPVEMQSFDSGWQNLIHEQYWSSLEASQLLLRTARWVPSPALMADQLRSGAFWAQRQGEILQAAVGGPMAAAAAACIMGHAIHTVPRLGPLLPPEADLTDPFAMALATLDLKAGQLVQTQIRFLKDAPHGLPPLQVAADLERLRGRLGELWESFTDSLAD